MDELKSLNLTLGFYFLNNLKNLNSDFLGFLKPCQTALMYTRYDNGSKLTSINLHVTILTATVKTIH